MIIMKKLFKQRALVAYFALAYSIAWGGIVIINYFTESEAFGGEGVLSEGVSFPLMLVWLAMLAGPALAGLAMARIIDGKEGLKKLFQSMFRWKVNIRWYAAALLIFPVLLVAITYSLTPFSSNYTPGLMIATGIAGGIIGGFFEEIGWTGFALPKLQLKYTPFFASISLGFIHTLWHFLPDYLGGINFYQEFYFLHFLLWIIALIAFRVIAVWIYNRSKSVLLAALAHGSFTGSQLVLGPPDVTAAQSVLWYGVFTFLLSFVAVLVIISDEKFFFKRVRRGKHRKISFQPGMG
jgi:uncharacterized protein